MQILVSIFNKEALLPIAVDVDNLIVASLNRHQIDSIKTGLMKELRTKDLMADKILPWN